MKILLISILLFLSGNMTQANTEKPTDLITRYEMEKIIAANDPEQRALNAIDKNLESSVQIQIGNKSGSGFFVTEHLILTVYHVLGDGVIYVILNNGKRINGTLVKTSMITDYALIQVVESGKPVTIAEKARLGETAIAIGSPMDLLNTVSKGIVSGLDMDINGRKMTQIDVPVNKGNSGGMLLNLNGELIGMIQSRISKDKDTGDMVSDISFAARIKEIKEFIKY